MYFKPLILTTLAAFLGGNNFNHTVDARSDGSPVCAVGGSAVQFTHLTRPSIITGSIVIGSFAVMIGSKTLNSSIVNTIDGSKDLPLVLSSLNGTQFRGVLIVLNEPNVSLTSNLFISPNSTEYKTQANCSAANYAGFTHVSSALKNSATATINLPINRTAFLDVDRKSVV